MADLPEHRMTVLSGMPYIIMLRVVPNIKSHALKKSLSWAKITKRHIQESAVRNSCNQTQTSLSTLQCNMKASMTQ